KSMQKMLDVARSGKTILFVSHNLAAVSTLCSRGILLRKGEMVLDAPIEEALRAYTEEAATGESIYVRKEKVEGDIVLERAHIENAQGEQTGELLFGEPFSVVMEFDVRKVGEGVSIAVRVEDSLGRLITVLTNQGEEERFLQSAAKYTLRCHVPNNVLVPGEYSLTVRGRIKAERRVFAVESCIAVRIDERRW